MFNKIKKYQWYICTLDHQLSLSLFLKLIFDDVLLYITF